MANHHQIQDTINECVSIVKRYHETERTRRNTSVMSVELQAIAAWVHWLGLEEDEVDQLIAHPLRERLIGQYGHELGSWFAIEFMKEFDSLLSSEQRSLSFQSAYGALIPQMMCPYLQGGERDDK